MSEYLNDYYGAKIHGIDGGLGYLTDFHFDDRDWIIRAIVVDTGFLFPRKRVLLGPEHLTGILQYGKDISANLTREEISNQPSLRLYPTSVLPYEKGHPGNLHDAVGSGHSRSAKSLHKRWIESSDGKRGFLSGFMVDWDQRKITDIVASKGPWYSNRQILVTPENLRRMGPCGPAIRSRRLQFASF